MRKPNIKRSNLGPKTYKYAFIGYCGNSKAYRFLNLDTNEILESRDVKFSEHIYAKEKLKSKLISTMSPIIYMKILLYIFTKKKDTVIHEDSHDSKITYKRNLHDDLNPQTLTRLKISNTLLDQFFSFFSWKEIEKRLKENLNI